MIKVSRMCIGKFCVFVMFMCVVVMGLVMYDWMYVIDVS